MTIHLEEVSTIQRQSYLQHAIGPRPVCFASTIDMEGNVNLSPFSFFNLFSITPPIVVFSPSRRSRDNTTKHTYENVLQVPEVVINIVDYEMVQQVSLASCDFPKGTNEFLKAGFTEMQASRVRPPMVKESKVQLECRVKEVQALGTEGGAGNLVICEVLVMHINDDILGADGMIDQTRLHHVARLGGDWYCKVDAFNLFKVTKPNIKIGIGIDQLPENIRHSKILTGNNLAQLGNVDVYPVIDPSFEDEKIKSIFQYYAINPDDMEKELHLYAKELLNQGKVEEAWQVLLALI